jgi:hypothetical protein
MSTLKSQYENYLFENQESKMTFEEWEKQVFEPKIKKFMERDTSWDDPVMSDGDLPQTNKTKFQVGDKAVKLKGYKFPCTIVSVFKTVDGNVRIVGEMDEYGLLHIFNEDQLEHIKN